MNRAELKKQIRYYLSVLSETNGHHQFEGLCFELARARVASNLLPATGPVSAGGDQGRDFETYRRFSKSALDSDDGTRKAVFTATLQKKNLKKKVKDDLAEALSANDGATHAFVYLGEGLPVGVRHELQDWARTQFKVQLEIFDGSAISDQLADPDTFWIAVEFLSLPAELRPFAVELSEEYRRILEQWPTERVPVDFADFIEIRRALRKATFSDAARADISHWLAKMNALRKHPSPALARRADYEFLVAQLRGKGDWIGFERDVKDYFENLPSAIGAAEISDTVIMLTYAQASLSRGWSRISADEITLWRRTLTQVVADSLAATSYPHLRFALLRSAATLAAFAEPGHSDWDRAIAAWSEAIDVAERSQLPPLESLADQIDMIAPIARRSELTALQQRLDALLADRQGSSVVAERARDRAIELAEGGQLVDAIHQLHISKARWFSGDTMRGSVLCVLMLAHWYSDLGLHYAARLFAAAAVRMAFALSDERQDDVGLTSRSMFALAETYYRAGEGLTFLFALHDACNVHAAAYADAWDFERHKRATQLLVAAGTVLGVASRSVPAHLGAYDEAIRQLPLPDELIEMLGETPDLERWKSKSAEEVDRICYDSLGHSLFEDVGATRSIRWRSLGMAWEAEFPNAAKVIPIAEAAVGLLQVLQVELSRVDLLLIPSTIKLTFEFFSRGEPDFQEVGGNNDGQWIVRLPLDATERDVESVLLRFAIEALSVSSGLTNDELKEAFEASATAGLFGRLFFLRPWPELVADVRPRGLESTEILRGVSRAPSELTWPEENQELSWFEGPGRGYDEDEALQAIKNRYERTIAALAHILPRLRERDDWQAQLNRLRADDYKDWQILQILANACVSKIAPVGSTEEAKILKAGGWKPLFDQLATAELSDEDLQEIIDSIDMHEKVGIGTAAAFWNVVLRRSAADFTGLRKLLDVRYRYSADDIAHDDPFA